MSCSANVAPEAFREPQNSIDRKKYAKVSKKIKKRSKSYKRKPLLNSSSNCSSQNTNSKTIRKRNPKSHSQNAKKTPAKLDSFEACPLVENNEGSELKTVCHMTQLSINTNYLDEKIESNLKNETMFCPQNFLEKHQISGKLRSKMVDWLLEVCKSFEFNEMTFFLALNLMDRYFYEEKQVLQPKDMHLIGVTCLFIAMKIEEPVPLKLSILVNKIAYSKFTVSELQEKEMIILEKLQFKLFGPTIHHFVEQTITKLKLSDYLDENIFGLLVKLLNFNETMVIYEYSLLTRYKYSLMAACIILVSFKLLQKIVPEFNLGCYNTKVKNILRLNEKEILDAASQTLILAKNFDEIYGKDHNLKRFSNDLFEEIQNFQTKKN